MHRILLLFLVICVTKMNAQEIVPNKLVREQSNFERHEIFKPTSVSGRHALPEVVKDYSILKLDKSSLQKIVESKSSAIELYLPSTSRNSYVLQLVEVKQYGVSFRDGATGQKIKFKPGRHFRGIIKGDEKSVVALSFYDDDVMGIISSKSSHGNQVLGKLEDGSGDYIIYDDEELLGHSEFECGTKDPLTPYSDEQLRDNSSNRALTDCVKLYFEVDDDIVTQKGGTTNTINYVTGLYNQVATLYAAESINTTLSEVYVWTTTSPYVGPSSLDFLNQFQANRPTFNGNLAMLLSYGGSGGIAYVNTLCLGGSTNYKIGFSNIQSTYNTVPTYSWSVEVVTHEFGHLLGSQHTHACVWNGNNTAIDGCYTVEGSCSTPPIPPASVGGTIMSYCHLTSAGINFANGFGTQPGNVIRNAVTNATCTTACPGGAPTCSDGIQNQGETGIDCGGPNCPACPTGCTNASGTLTLTLDSYPEETTWNITLNGTIVYSGGPYAAAQANTTVTVPVCLNYSCYVFNIYDSFGDGICCAYGNGSYSLVVNGVSVAGSTNFTGASQTTNFCLTAPASCSDGIQNQGETGVDCGGPCPACPPVPTCTDGIQNQGETGVDCGGPCPACPPVPTCTDGIQNQGETGVDCGGPCPACPPVPTCTDGIQNQGEAGVDCGGPCPACPPAPTCTDGIQNQGETGVDCGGPCPACPPAPTCTDGIQNQGETGVDCGGPCPACPPAPTCTDGIQNQGETGVDCGGPCPACPTCNDGIKNQGETGIDCGGPCPACPTCSDGIKNQGETGVDCGGPCPACPTCFDGIKNQGETGVDCGGPCPACPTCSDGIKNQGETGVDCGGPCPACPTCFDGIKNQGETGVDCGGPCPACPTLLGGYYFETGWDGWSDGGIDVFRYQGTRSAEGQFSIALRDDTGNTGSTNSPTFTTAQNYNFLKIQFKFYLFSFETGEDFFLQYSNNNGTTWTTIGTYVRGTTYNNQVFYTVTTTIPKSTYNFTNQSKFRFRADASADDDLVYIDAVQVWGQSTNSLVESIALGSMIDQEEQEISVYPNPTSDILNVEFKGNIYENVDVILYDITGRKATQKSLGNGNAIQLDINNINQGVYMLKMIGDGEVIHSQKVIIIH